MNSRLSFAMLSFAMLSFAMLCFAMLGWAGLGWAVLCCQACTAWPILSKHLHVTAETNQRVKTAGCFMHKPESVLHPIHP